MALSARPLIYYNQTMGSSVLTLAVNDRPDEEDQRSALPFRELDRVQTLVATLGEEGEDVPAGSTGTIVAVWGEGAAFEVEFTRPVETLVAIRPEALRLVDRPGV